MKARILALGNEAAGDDGAAIEAVRTLEGKYEIVIAGRPGSRLLDILEGSQPTVLVDVIRSGMPPGHIVSLPLSAVARASVASPQMSSHGFGPSEVLRLGNVLGRPLPPGHFVGIEGIAFQVGQPQSPELTAAMDDFVEAILSALRLLEN